MAVTLFQEQPSELLWKALGICLGNSQAGTIVQFGTSLSAGFGRALCPVRRLRPYYCILFITFIALDVHKGLVGCFYRIKITTASLLQAQVIPAAAFN